MRTFEAKSNGATQRRGYATNSTLAGINLLDHNHPTELYYRRHELLLQEAGDARVPREVRASRQKAAPKKGSDRHVAGLQRAIALWGRTSVPFFRA
jgi:hypothetical protein